MFNEQTEPLLISKRQIQSARIRPTRVADDSREVLVISNSNGGEKILSTVCPHFGGPLELSGDMTRLVCQWHGWEFSTASGECLNRRVNCRITIFRDVLIGEE